MGGNLLLSYMVPYWLCLPHQVRNKLNQDQNVKLQQQRESLNKRNLEVASMDRRVAELRERLWKKKAALQQKDNLPVRSVQPKKRQQFNSLYRWNIPVLQERAATLLALTSHMYCSDRK